MTTPPDSAATPRSVRCPACRRATAFSPDNPWRPFCSERCKRGDLGAWATESYRVAAAPPAEDDDADPTTP